MNLEERGLDVGRFFSRRRSGVHQPTTAAIGRARHPESKRSQARKGKKKKERETTTTTTGRAKKNETHPRSAGTDAHKVCGPGGETKINPATAASAATIRGWRTRGSSTELKWWTVGSSTGTTSSSSSQSRDGHTDTHTDTLTHRHTHTHTEAKRNAAWLPRLRAPVATADSDWAALYTSS